MKPLTDEDKMPWGKHKGVKMIDVPASYFHWLWTNPTGPLSRRTAVCPVADYIKRNLLALIQEHPDGIWRDE